jgi:hypothetical protein
VHAAVMSRKGGEAWHSHQSTEHCKVDCAEMQKKQKNRPGSVNGIWCVKGS